MPAALATVAVATLPGWTSAANAADAGSESKAIAAARSYVSDMSSPGLDGPHGRLRVSDAQQPAAPGSVVRFQQLYRGVPVLGGELVTRLDRGRRLLAMSGEVSPAQGLPTRPRLALERAAELARRVTAQSDHLDVAGLATSRPRLWIYDPRLLGGPGAQHPALVWRVEVTAPNDDPTFNRLVLIDARDGSLALSFEQTLAAGPDRRICDADSTALAVCEPPYTRAEGDPPTGISDVDRAYRNLGLTYDFYEQHFGRDSFDGRGERLVAVVRYCSNPSPTACPDRNAAFANGLYTAGHGWVTTDVVGHEITHGITSATSNLLYYEQSGAINESMSDVFGELIEHENDPGNPSWLWGEGVPGGPIRDMQDPRRFNQPNRMRSPYYDPLGEVHTNSGVGNKAAYLIAEGGRFRGARIRGLGIAKTAAIYYEAQVSLLTSASGYVDLARALPRACDNLSGGAEGIAAADCAEVRAAVKATQMRRKAPKARVRRPQTCPRAGTHHRDTFYDDLENPGRRLWRAGNSGWSYPQPPNQTYATSGRTNFYADPDRPRLRGKLSTIAMRRAVPVPRHGYMHFRHSYDFPDLGDGPHVGAVVEYRLAGARRWHDAGPLFDAGGYNGRVETGRGNPLARREPRRAFTGGSYGYGAGRLDLSRLAGERVRFRFRFGNDAKAVFYGRGWYIDDIRVYRCTGD